MSLASPVLTVRFFTEGATREACIKQYLRAQRGKRGHRSNEGRQREETEEGLRLSTCPGEGRGQILPLWALRGGTLPTP